MGQGRTQVIERLCEFSVSAEKHLIAQEDIPWRVFFVIIYFKAKSLL
jgi:hypothetical protein